MIRVQGTDIWIQFTIFFPTSPLPPLQGIDEGPEGLKLISDIIREKMGIDMSVLMGANIANEVAAEKFCETTIGKTHRCKHHWNDWSG